MTCIMEHIDITAGKDDNTHNVLQVGSMRISSMPLGRFALRMGLRY